MEGVKHPIEPSEEQIYGVGTLVVLRHATNLLAKLVVGFQPSDTNGAGTAVRSDGRPY